MVAKDVILPRLRKDDVGKTVLSRSLEVVNLSGFLKEEVVLCFMVGFVFITSISGCFWRNLVSTLGSLNGVVIVDCVEASAEVESSSGLFDNIFVLTFSSSIGGNGVVDL